VARVSVAMLRLRLGTNKYAVSGAVNVPNRPALSLSSIPLVTSKRAREKEKII
jgi:hypothetical protein